MAFSHILWDFNGTILNDVDTGVKCANVLLSRRHMKTLDSVDSYRKLFCFPIIQYYRNLGLDMEKEPFEDLAVEWMEQYLFFSRDSKAYTDTVELISRLKNRKVPQIILSATEKTTLIDQLTGLGLISYFDELLALDNIHAYSKVDIAKEWVSKVKPETPVMIGDTVHDYEVATEIGAACILISNGHQSNEKLKACGVPVFQTAQELQASGLLGVE